MKKLLILAVAIVLGCVAFSGGAVRVQVASCEKYYLENSTTTTTVKSGSGVTYGVIAGGTAAGNVTLADSTTTFATIYVAADETTVVIFPAPIWFSTNFKVTNSTTALKTTILYK